MTKVKLSKPVLRNASLLATTPFMGLFDEFFNTPAFSGTADYVPAVNISESDTEFTLEFSAPGFSKENFSVGLENNLLTVSGEFKKEESTSNKNYSRREFTMGSFKRSFNLPENVNLDGITASYNNGILTVTIPKVIEVPENKVKQIAIQ